MRTSAQTRPDIRRVSIEKIVVDPKLTPREREDPEVVNQYAYAMDFDRFPPIQATETRRGEWLLLDGGRRLAAHKLRGEKTVAVEVIVVPAAQLFEWAFLANFRHGTPYTQREILLGAQRLIAEGSSPKRVARLIRMPEAALGRALRKLRGEFCHDVQPVRQGDPQRPPEVVPAEPVRQRDPQSEPVRQGNPQRYPEVVPAEAPAPATRDVGPTTGDQSPTPAAPTPAKVSPQPAPAGRRADIREEIMDALARLLEAQELGHLTPDNEAIRAGMTRLAGKWFKRLREWEQGRK